MQSVKVRFGKASFIHASSTLLLEAEASASIQSHASSLDSSVSVEASQLSLLRLWTRARCPLRFGFTFLYKSSGRSATASINASFEELIPALASDMVSS
jgi:hypothetical protein